MAREPVVISVCDKTILDVVICSKTLKLSDGPPELNWVLINGSMETSLRKEVIFVPQVIKNVVEDSISLKTIFRHTANGALRFHLSKENFSCTKEGK